MKDAMRSLLAPVAQLSHHLGISEARDITNAVVARPRFIVPPSGHVTLEAVAATS
jgi:hypothetical protein